MNIERTIELADQGQPEAIDELASYLADLFIGATSKQEAAEAIKILLQIIWKRK